MSNRRTRKLELDAARELFDSLGPFFVVVDGGVCQYVGNEQIDLLNTGRAEVIDFDCLETDPETTWERLSKQAQEFFQGTYPDDFKKYRFKIRE
jgi:hypothetical protein